MCYSVEGEIFKCSSLSASTSPSEKGQKNLGPTPCVVLSAAYRKFLELKIYYTP